MPLAIVWQGSPQQNRPLGSHITLHAVTIIIIAIMFDACVTSSVLYCAVFVFSFCAHTQYILIMVALVAHTYMFTVSACLLKQTMHMCLSNCLSSRVSNQTFAYLTAKASVLWDLKRIDDCKFL